ncbi:hypothetical protein FOVG_03261 [Fusarium oxysporum f. sp. pisi HDV247]|uniref:Uncharacterized protein n=1 Tax=Fusarium oxysporum f. sp. pisi HDV247 TaxID=1080344 RepID=W9PZJ0_FUSOX|nr:hypothetical protein FOVG_03261 [Fusarium oxysporum f. sp. pisi HDV247]
MSARLCKIYPPFRHRMAWLLYLNRTHGHKALRHCIRTLMRDGNVCCGCTGMKRSEGKRISMLCVHLRFIQRRAPPPNYLSQASAPSKIQYQSGFGWLLWMNR